MSTKKKQQPAPRRQSTAAKKKSEEEQRQAQLDSLRQQINGVFAQNMIMFLQHVQHPELGKMTIQHGGAMQLFATIAQLDPPAPPPKQD
jgi:hypothetical protein